MNLEELKGKEIEIWTTNRFHYQGVLLDFDKTAIKFKDEINGIMVLNFSIIRSIVEHGRRK